MGQDTQTVSAAPTVAELAPTERVAEILEAACRVIARDGAHGLHMKTVAREAGVSKALVHYYVATRQELLRQAIAYADARCREQVEAELAPLANGAARLEWILLAYAGNESAFTESQALWNAAWGSLKLDEELAPAVRAGYRRWADWIAALVDEGKADGSLRSSLDTADTVLSLSALAEGLSSLVDVGMTNGEHAVALMRRSLALIVDA